MDQRRFDALARALAARATRRAGLAALVAALSGAGRADAERRDVAGRRARTKGGATASSGGARCGDRTPCPDGFSCERMGRRRRCVCPSGVTCGAACCAAGEACRDGACAAPEPACLSAGSACKNAGRPCCAGTVCASGQGGMMDVACYGAAGSACAVAADCAYGTSCRGGTCTVDCPCSVCAGWNAEANGLGLQAALTLAEPGSTILVQAGTYASPMNDLPIPELPYPPQHPMFVLQRSVTIVPCGDGDVTIGSLWIDGDVDVALRGISLVGSAQAPALWPMNVGRGRPRVTVSGCTLTGTSVGAAVLDAQITLDGGTRVSGNASSGITGSLCDVRLVGPVTVARNGSTGIRINGGSLHATGDVRVVDNVGFEGPGGIAIRQLCLAGSTPGSCQSTAMARAYLEGTTVSGNEGDSGQPGGIQAGGILVDGELVAVGLTVRDNWSGPRYGNSDGGGIAVKRFDCGGAAVCDPGGRATLTNCRIEGNRSGPDPERPGIPAPAGRGGGIALLAGATLTMGGTTVTNNAALAAQGNGTGTPTGGGIWSEDDISATTSFSGVSGNQPNNCANVSCT